jgi:hypothetical protein
MNSELRINRTLRLVATCAFILSCSVSALAQNSEDEFHRILQERVAFDQADFVALQQGQTVVKLLPVQDKREVAVSGVVKVQVPAEVFLQSFRESMLSKSSAAILEIGSFSNQPTLDDLKNLTIENRDIEDLKKCVIGDCQLKLSATMIERFRKEVDWEGQDYRNQATHLFKTMLLDYVRDYMARGDVGLIEYHDKANEVRLAEEQRDLLKASGYLNKVLPEFPQQLRAFPKSNVGAVENWITWSKIKFGLKPVFAINHITIYKTDKQVGPQIVIASKQIYANHYFDSSLGLTTFVNIPGASSGTFLLYESRSRADGLEGMFSKLKRNLVEDKAVDGLRGILEQSRLNLNARMFTETESEAPVAGGRNWKRLAVGRGRLFFALFLITALGALLAVTNYHWKDVASRGAHH